MKKILLTVTLLSTIATSAHAQSDQHEGEILGLSGGRPYFHITSQKIELSGTGNDGVGIGLTAGYEMNKATVLGTPNISLTYTFAGLDNDIDYSGLALMGGFRGWGTTLYPVYGAGVGRQMVDYPGGESTSFNQLLYYGGLGIALGNQLSASLVYSGSSPLGDDDSNPANDNIGGFGVRLSYGSFSGVARY